MNAVTRFVPVAMLAATSCFAAPPPPPPPEVAAESSRTLAVHAPKLKFEDGAWRLSGCVAPRPETVARLTTHLDVVCLSASGTLLAAQVVTLKPSALRFRVRAPRPHTCYALPSDFVPAATARIEVRADDGTIPQP